MVRERGAASAVAALAVLGLAGTSWAQAVPPDFTAAPDVYKVVAQNAQYRLVEATWKPGQRDAFHSHPSMVYYWLTPCSLRFHFPDNTTHDDNVVAGQAGMQEGVVSHSVENRGTSVC